MKIQFFHSPIFIFKSNIGDYEIDYLSLDHIEEEERKVSSYILKDGDLLISARGNGNKNSDIFVTLKIPEKILDVS